MSNRENGYTLADIHMLCALADYFDVTTDAPLGRTAEGMYAVIAVTSPELGQAITGLAKRYGFITKHICSSYAEALEIVKTDASITHLFANFDEPMEEEEKGETPDGLCSIESHALTKQQVLDELRSIFGISPLTMPLHKNAR